LPWLFTRRKRLPGLDKGRVWDLTGAPEVALPAARRGRFAMSKEKGRPGREKKKPKADKKAAPASASFLRPEGGGKTLPTKSSGK
jgi:hypothetical protein